MEAVSMNKYLFEAFFLCTSVYFIFLLFLLGFSSGSCLWFNRFAHIL